MGVHKTIDEAGENLDKAVAYIPERYKKAVGKADWAGPAASEEAESNYAAGVSEAVANKSRQKGIREIDNSVWVRAAQEKGGSAIGPGIKRGLGKYKANIRAPMEAAIAAADSAPAKTRDWRENIANRLIPVVEAERRAVGKE